ncbi:hypothetical protein OHU34_41030 [Streptomyces sp. NBC_00080]|nr:hypothetical protein [Streptomyces sp. SLBN-115]
MRRFTEGSGIRPAPALPAELLTLMDKLAGPPTSGIVPTATSAH